MLNDQTLLLPDVFLTQFSALQTSRSVRTRRLAAAEENTEVTRTARLAHIFKEICDMITSYKGELSCDPCPDLRSDQASRRNLSVALCISVCYSLICLFF